MLLLQIQRFKDPAQHGPVLVLGCADWQRQVLKDELVRLQQALRELNPDAADGCVQQPWQVPWVSRSKHKYPRQDCATSDVPPLFSVSLPACDMLVW